MQVGSGVMRIGRGIVVVAVAAGLVGCGSPAVSEGDRVACERYVGAHDAFQSRMDEVTEVTSRGEQVSPELVTAFTGEREAAHASVGDALAVAEDPGLVLALREADRVKGGLLSRDADASAAYFITEHVVNERCSEIMSPEELRPLK